MPDLTTPTTTGGFAADLTVELEQNSKGINKRIRVNIQWENWSANTAFPDVVSGKGIPDGEPDSPEDFMVGLGDGAGGSGKNQPARLVLARLLLEGVQAAEAAIAAGLDPGKPTVLDHDFIALVDRGALMEREP